MLKQELLSSLNTIKPALATKELIKVFTCFHFNDRGYVSAFNDMIGMSIRVPIKLQCAVSGDLLLTILGNIYAADVDVEQRDGGLHISTSNTGANLPLLELDDIPYADVGYPGDDQTIELTPEFMDAIEVAFIALDPTASRTILTCLTIQQVSGEESITVSASNGKTIVQCVITNEMPEPILVLPYEFCKQARALWNAFSENYIFRLEVSQNEVRLFVKEDGASDYYIMLGCRQGSHDDLLDYDTTIGDTLDVAGDINFIKVPDGLTNALTLASNIATPNTFGGTKLTIKKEALTLDTQDIATANSVVDIEEPHKAVTTAVDATAILKGLSIFNQICFTPRVTLMTNDNADIYLISNKA